MNTNHKIAYNKLESRFIKLYAKHFALDENDACFAFVKHGYAKRFSELYRDVFGITPERSTAMDKELQRAISYVCEFYEIDSYYDKETCEQIIIFPITGEPNDKSKSEIRIGSLGAWNLFVQNYLEAYTGGTQ